MAEEAPQPMGRPPEYSACEAATTRAIKTMVDNGTPSNIRDLYFSVIELFYQYNERVLAVYAQYNRTHPGYVVGQDGLVYEPNQTPFTVGVNPTTAEVRVQPSYRSHIPGIIKGKNKISITPGTEDTPGAVRVIGRFKPLGKSGLSPEKIVRITAAMKAINEADRRRYDRQISDEKHIDKLYAALRPLFPQTDINL